MKLTQKQLKSIVASVIKENYESKEVSIESIVADAIMKEFTNNLNIDSIIKDIETQIQVQGEENVLFSARLEDHEVNAFDAYQKFCDKSKYELVNQIKSIISQVSNSPNLTFEAVKRPKGSKDFWRYAPALEHFIQFDFKNFFDNPVKLNNQQYRQYLRMLCNKCLSLLDKID